MGEAASLKLNRLHFMAYSNPKEKDLSFDPHVLFSEAGEVFDEPEIQTAPDNLLEVNLLIAPGVRLSPEEFAAHSEAGYLNTAADGAVMSKPFIKLLPDRVEANFDHHEDVDRWNTPSSAQQVLNAITDPESEIHIIIKSNKLPDGTPLLGANMLVNDMDQDSFTAAWLLRNAELVQYLAENPQLPEAERLFQFVQDTGDMDRTSAYAGVYIPPERHGIMNKVFEAYTTARTSGAYYQGDKLEQAERMEALYNQMDKEMFNMMKGEIIPLDSDGSYDKVAENEFVTLVHETGQQSRVQMFRDKIERFISVVNETDGKTVFSIGRATPDVLADLPGLCDKLNALENAKRAALGLDEQDYVNPFGGSDLTIGSSGKGSLLTPAEVMEVSTSHFASLELSEAA